MSSLHETAKAPVTPGLLTAMLRTSCDLNMLESWEDRRLIARLVAEVVDDRASKISLSKLFKTSDLGFQVAERSYIGRTTSVS